LIQIRSEFIAGISRRFALGILNSSRILRLRDADEVRSNALPSGGLPGMWQRSDIDEHARPRRKWRFACRFRDDHRMGHGRIQPWKIDQAFAITPEMIYPA